ncbi:unnamed protein product [Pylaiella littoralis]
MEDFNADESFELHDIVEDGTLGVEVSCTLLLYDCHFLAVITRLLLQSFGS